MEGNFTAMDFQKLVFARRKVSQVVWVVFSGYLGTLTVGVAHLTVVNGLARLSHAGALWGCGRKLTVKRRRDRCTGTKRGLAEHPRSSHI
jgi:hypothetical protein